MLLVLAPGPGRQTVSQCQWPFFSITTTFRVCALALRYHLTLVLVFEALRAQLGACHWQ